MALTRRVGWLEPKTVLRALDLRSLETRETLRSEFALWLHEHGYRDFDVSDALNRDRGLTQHISRWAYVHGYRAIAYTSRFGAEFDCWVLYDADRLRLTEGPTFTPRGIEIIEHDDPDLGGAARLFGLKL